MLGEGYDRPRILDSPNSKVSGLAKPLAVILPVFSLPSLFWPSVVSLVLVIR